MLASSSSQSTCCSFQRGNYTPCRLPRHVDRRVAGIVSASQNNRSFDSADEEAVSSGSRMADEFADVADPKRVERMKHHLALLWKVQKARRPQTCDCCSGTGEVECGWCHGTGVMTVGDQVFASNRAKASECPVCKAKGYVKCEHCKGTGRRAQWLGQTEGCPTPGAPK